MNETSAAERMARPLGEFDPEIAEAIRSETERQHEHLELIASENFVSQAVLEAMGSVFTNKYAEGYPGKRYYGGCEYADRVENLARDRAKELFGAEHANVQPQSPDQLQQRALAGAVLADQAEGHAPGDFERHILQGPEVAVIGTAVGGEQLLETVRRAGVDRVTLRDVSDVDRAH